MFTTLQYPMSRTVRFRTQAVRFLDGTEQRYRDFGSPLRRWRLRLDLLTEQELELVEAFFTESRGRFESFTFKDPRDGKEYANCSIESDELTTDWMGELRGRTEITIRQGRS